MPQLDFSIFPSQFFWLAISFFLMLFIFSRFIIPKTGEMINLRKAKIDEYLEKAAALKVKVEKTLDKYNQALKKATDAANASLAETKEEMDTMIERRQAELAADLKKRVAESEAKIAASKAKALKQLEPAAAELAQDVLRKLGFEDIKAADVAQVLQQMKENQDANGR